MPDWAFNCPCAPCLSKRRLHVPRSHVCACTISNQLAGPKLKSIYPQEFFSSWVAPIFFMLGEFPGFLKAPPNRPPPPPPPPPPPNASPPPPEDPRSLRSETGSLEGEIDSKELKVAMRALGFEPKKAPIRRENSTPSTPKPARVSFRLGTTQKTGGKQKGASKRGEGQKGEAFGTK